VPHHGRGRLDRVSFTRNRKGAVDAEHESRPALRARLRRRARGRRDHRFFYESEFTDNEAIRDAVFGILDVNGWHNVVHIATGALGLLAFAAGAYAARAYAFGLGAVYIVVAIWGFIVGDGDSILSIVPVNTEDNILHLLIGIVGLAAGAATPAEAPRGEQPA
jgi:hypothetical protein